MDNMGYESPINVITSGLRLQAEKEMGHAVVKALQNIQVEINEKELMEILQADRRRYQEAYKRGWEACKERYDGILRGIRDQADCYLGKEKED